MAGDCIFPLIVGKSVKHNKKLNIL